MLATRVEGVWVSLLWRRRFLRGEREKRMAEFLVHIRVNWPADGDEMLKSRLVSAETVRAGELVSAGKIQRLWRVPGRWENWGVWDAADATELHSLIISLPFFPWLSVDVMPLANHPSDPRGQSP
jgi:muconolactone D-isomerase